MSFFIYFQPNMYQCNELSTIQPQYSFSNSFPTQPVPTQL